MNYRMKSGCSRDAVAFVLQARACGLGVIRSLGREMISVVAADPDHGAPGLRSHYCKSHVIPDPEVQPSGTLDFLLREGEKMSEKAILYPSSDPFVIFISKYRKPLSERFRLILPPGNLAGGLVSKQYQYAEALRVGMPIPTSYYPSILEDVESIKDSIQYPVLIKPFLSHLCLSKFNRKGFVAQSSEELMTIFRQLLPCNLNVMVQSVIPGPITNLFEIEAYVGQDGNILGSLTRQKLRQFPEDFGLGTLFTTVHNKEVLRLGTDFLRSIGYKGIANIEFKLDERDGNYKMIEINPRFSLQNIQGIHAGVNLPLIQYLDLTDQPLPSMPDYEDGIVWLDASRDIFACQSQCSGYGASGYAFLRSWLGADCYAYFSLDDPLPSLARFSSPKGLLDDITAQRSKTRIEGESPL